MATRLEDVLGNTPDPRQGLPDDVFNFIRKVTPLVNVDLLVRFEDRHLLAWREDEYETGWHIPGGIIRFREAMKTRIDAVASHELGATVHSEEEPCAMNELRHHERGHFISLLFRCELTSELDPARMFAGRGRPRHGSLSWIRGIPNDLYRAQEFYASWLEIT